MRQSSRHIRYIAIALIAFGIGGCDFFGGLLPGGDSPESPDGVIEPVTPDPSGTQPQQPGQATQPGGDTGTPGTEPFGDPTVTGEDPVVGNLPLDLIPSTDPNARAAQVGTERADPFGSLTTRPVVNRPPVTEEGPPSGIEPGELAPIPELVPGQPFVPPPLIPEIARAIAVTGVVQLGNVPYAIVDAPNEPHSRYVREGQFLSNGEVLVKRISINPGGEPVVVFEQFGIEVSTTVGSGGVPDDAAATAAIAIFQP